MTIEILVANRKASNKNPKVPVICGNKDYVVHFEFDAEWDAYETKTARFVTANGYFDVLFDGSECAVPVLNNVSWAQVGVYAGDLYTTTRAYIRVEKSILCGDDPPHPEPSEDIYNQLLEKMNALELATVSPEAIEKAVADYLEENPVEGGVDFTTDETLTLDPVTKVLSVNTADAPEQDNTLPITSAAVHTTVGNIEVLLSTI